MNGRPGSCSLSPKGLGHDMDIAGALLAEYQARSPRLVAWARASFEQGALPSLLFLVLCQSLPYQETECSRPPDFATINSGHLSCMPMAELKLGWHKHYSRLQARGGSLWLPQWLAPLAKNPFGRTLAPQLTLNSGPTPLSTRNWSCSYPVGNVGIGSIPGSAINTWLKNVNLAGQYTVEPAFLLW